MYDHQPQDPSDHAEDFALRYASKLDLYCAERMQALGIPDNLNGADDPYAGRPWQAFVAEERTGGHVTHGLTINSGVLNPRLLEGKGSRIWARARLKDRIDAVIAHEWEEYRLGSHEAALKEAPKTGLPITDGARRILRAMAR